MKRTKLKTKAPLQAKTPLRTKKPIAKKPKQHTISWYKHEATKWFNRAVKYRDSENIEGMWMFTCITCPRRVLFKDREGRFYRTANAGHFQPEIRSNTRYDWRNVNGQCTVCNYQGLGEQVKYARAIDEKYGTGIAVELEKLAHIPHTFTIDELQAIIKEAKEECAVYEQT